MDKLQQIDKAKLDEWRAKADAATPGPLAGMSQQGQTGLMWSLWYSPQPQPHAPPLASFQRAEDARLFQAARDAVPELLDEVERLTYQLEVKQDALLTGGTICRKLKAKLELAIEQRNRAVTTLLKGDPDLSEIIAIQDADLAAVKVAGNES